MIAPLAARAKSVAAPPPVLRKDERAKYLIGALCLAMCAIMLAPLVASISASLKTTQEAAAIPPTYFTHQLSLDSYQQALELSGGPADLSRQQRRHGAADHRLLPRADHSGRIRAGAVPGARQGVRLRLSAACADRPLSVPADADLLHVRPAAPDQHAGRPRHRSHDDPDPVQRLHHAQQLRGGAARNRGGGGHRRRIELAGARIRLPAGDPPGDRHRFAVRLHHFVERVPRRAGDHEPQRRPSLCR